MARDFFEDRMRKQYASEKSLVIGPVNQRTGLESFPTYEQWREEYLTEFTRDHRTVSVEEADRLIENELKKIDQEESQMTTTENTTTETTETAPVFEMPETSNPPARRVIKRKKTATKAAKANKGPSKAALARQLFQDNLIALAGQHIARKDMIGRFVKEIGLTEAGAGTYYQQFLRKAKDEGIWDKLVKEYGPIYEDEDEEAEVEPEVEVEPEQPAKAKRSRKSKTKVEPEVEVEAESEVDVEVA